MVRPAMCWSTELWKTLNYFKNLLNTGGDDIGEGMENEEEVGERQEQDNEITWDELEEALKMMKNDKAPG